MLSWGNILNENHLRGFYFRTFFSSVYAMIRFVGFSVWLQQHSAYYSNFSRLIFPVLLLSLCWTPAYCDVQTSVSTETTEDIRVALTITPTVNASPILCIRAPYSINLSKFSSIVYTTSSVTSTVYTASMPGTGFSVYSALHISISPVVQCDIDFVLTVLDLAMVPSYLTVAVSAAVDMISLSGTATTSSEDVKISIPLTSTTSDTDGSEIFRKAVFISDPTYSTFSGQSKIKRAKIGAVQFGQDFGDDL
eukprot:TRINITY_DN19716_c0_g1::TRINITY_DN19716_c0_g1_i2::g.3336::m.3336 TRINITY_DN19716_c0_g1::TRINITY_DN19716_c0_g1_i2::g.3336  ORF type:complete len:250 (+),score=1.59 TRINITY_DN19716_c0_g1_i2:1-750(+)